MRRAIPVLFVIGVVLAGCSRTGSPVIDTWPVGDELNCAELATCAELTRVGLTGLALRDSGHAPVIKTHLHAEGAIIDPATGHQILTTRSGGCCHVLVVDHTDGTTSAIGVGFPGVSREAVAIDWETITAR